MKYIRPENQEIKEEIQRKKHWKKTLKILLGRNKIEKGKQLISRKQSQNRSRTTKKNARRKCLDKEQIQKEAGRKKTGNRPTNTAQHLSSP